MTQTHDDLAKKIARLTGRIATAEKRMDGILGEFTDMLDCITGWISTYHDYPQVADYVDTELYNRSVKILERMREKYG